MPLYDFFESDEEGVNEGMLYSVIHNAMEHTALLHSNRHQP